MNSAKTINKFIQSSDFSLIKFLYNTFKVTLIFISFMQLKHLLLFILFLLKINKNVIIIPYTLLVCTLSF